jgi:hypothetical protein
MLRWCVFGVFFLPQILFSAAIRITNTSALRFGTATSGDSSLTIAPGTSENASNGSFRVTGDVNRAYTIILPVSAEITSGTGQNKDTIALSNFTSFPANGANGLIGTNGRQSVFVGATRAALRINQRPGSYSGRYTMTVVY